MDGFLIFANAINLMRKQGNWINNTGLECYTQNVTAWKGGTDLRKTALNVSNKLSFLEIHLKICLNNILTIHEKK